MKKSYAASPVRKNVMVVFVVGVSHVVLFVAVVVVVSVEVVLEVIP